MLKFHLIFPAVLLLPLCAAAQDILPYHLQEEHSWISTNYFGPNAFPVPDMLENTVGRTEVEALFSGAAGHLASTTDLTGTLEFRLRIPLWTDRANLSVWGQAHEWYRDTPEVRVLRRVSPDRPLVNDQQGDIYFSVDLRLVEESGWTPCVTLRGACKSAFGGQYTRARYYDCPGYFFDLCASRTFQTGPDSGLTLSATTGFLCWQVDNGRQNDAVMYGVSAAYGSPWIRISAAFGGYSGWKQEGDRPMTLKTYIDLLPGKRFSPVLQYEHGFRDWPFDRISVGLRLFHL